LSLITKTNCNGEDIEVSDQTENKNYIENVMSCLINNLFKPADELSNMMTTNKLINSPSHMRDF